MWITYIVYKKYIINFFLYKISKFKKFLKKIILDYNLKVWIIL